MTSANDLKAALDLLGRWAYHYRGLSEEILTTYPDEFQRRLLDTRTMLRTPLASSPVHQGVEDWKMVPVEPTLAMLDAMAQEIWPRAPAARMRNTNRDAYLAMIAAAPSPPQQQTGDK